MPTAGPFIARNLEVEVSTDDITYNGVERVEEAEFSGTLDKAEVSSNDSAGSKEYLPTWDDASLSLTVIADENATYQEVIWTSFNNKTRIYYRLRPRGVSAGDRQIKFLGIVESISEPLRKPDGVRYTFTIGKSGAATRNTQ